MNSRLNSATTRRMDELSVYTDAGWPHAPARKPQLQQLLVLLISDAVTDVEVVTRELGLREEMGGRLRRALDRIACAQRVLETTGPDGAEAGTEGATSKLRVREAVELLAREWPEEYPAGAVEWLVASSIGIPDFVCVS